MSTNTATYVESYDKLTKAVDSVNNCKDIDEVADLVKNGVEAYQVCMERVNKVQAMIAELQITSKD